MQRDPKAAPPRPTYSIFRSDCHLPDMDSGVGHLLDMDSGVAGGCARMQSTLEAPHTTSTASASRGPPVAAARASKDDARNQQYKHAPWPKSPIQTWASPGTDLGGSPAGPCCWPRLYNRYAELKP
jgi:hypothetical protein